jgi:uncharacterized protein (DUF58 family)
MLVVDASGSMGFGKKLHAARQLASTLAYMAIGQGDAAGLICSCESGSALIPPRRIPGQVSVLLERLGALQAVGSTMLEKTLHELAETIRERAFVVVISDMLIEPSSLRGAVDHLTFRKHDVTLFHLIDPRELQPDWDRPVRLEDMESDESMMIDPDEIAVGYETAVREFMDELEQISRETATDYHQVMLDRPIEESLMRFIAGRRRE